MLEQEPWHLLKVNMELQGYQDRVFSGAPMGRYEAFFQNTEGRSDMVKFLLLNSKWRFYEKWVEVSQQYSVCIDHNYTLLRDS